jgi:hypothetical protein
VLWLAELRALHGIRRRTRFALELLFPPPSMMVRWAGRDDVSRPQLVVLYVRRLVGAPVSASSVPRSPRRLNRPGDGVVDGGAAGNASRQAAELPVLRTTGRSMLPTLRPGDVVVIEAPTKALRLGDIAVFRRPEGLVVHRVVSRRARLQMGDNATTCLPYEPDDIEGVVTAVHGRGRARDLRSPAARLWRVPTAFVLHLTVRRGPIGRAAGRAMAARRRAHGVSPDDY